MRNVCPALTLKLLTIEPLFHILDILNKLKLLLIDFTCIYCYCTKTFAPSELGRGVLCFALIISAAQMKFVHY